MNSLALAITTYRELIRSKIIFLTLFFAFFVVAITSLFGSVTIGQQVYIIKDFGLFSVSLFPICFVVIAGSSLLNKELQRRTIFNVLSKPVRRSEFIIGKFLGLLLTSYVLMFLMGLSLCIYASWYEELIDPLLWYAYLYTALELIIICSLVMFFSSLVVTPILSGLLTLALFLVGRNADFILFFENEGISAGAATYMFRSIYWMVPHLNELYIGNGVVYGSAPSFEEFMVAAWYSASYVTIALTGAVLLFIRREFN